MSRNFCNVLKIKEIFSESIIPWPRPDFSDLSNKASVTEILQ